MILIRALEQDSSEAEMEVIEAAPGACCRTDRRTGVRGSQRACPSLCHDPLVDRCRFTVLFAGLMYWAMQSSGFGFWFYCLTFPFLLGVLLIALSAGGMSSRWLFVDVHQRAG